LNVCFWYDPPQIRKLDPDSRNKKLQSITQEVASLMRKEGSFMINYQPCNGKPNFFRLVLVSPKVKETDLEGLLDEIEQLGQKILKSENSQ